MRRSTAAAIVVTACSGAASASGFTSGPYLYTDPNTGRQFCGFDIDIGGFQSYDSQGASINQILDIFVGGFAVVDAIAWDVTLTTVGDSWASEATLNFEDQLSLSPGFSDGFPVTNANYNSGGPIYLSDLGLTPIIIEPDGILSIEFFESFDDEPGQADAVWQHGSVISIYTSGWPTPGPLATLACAGLIVTRRRR